jgi:hypothetical protein
MSYYTALSPPITFRQFTSAFLLDTSDYIVDSIHTFPRTFQSFHIYLYYIATYLGAELPYTHIILVHCTPQSAAGHITGICILYVPFHTLFASLLFVSASSTICLLIQHPFSSNSKPTMLENFSRTAAPAPLHINCPSSVVGNFMPSTLVSVSPPLPVHSLPYGGGNTCRGSSESGSVVGRKNDWRMRRGTGVGAGAGGQFVLWVQVWVLLGTSVGLDNVSGLDVIPASATALSPPHRKWTSLTWSNPLV